jgi:hypothetical protein
METTKVDIYDDRGFFGKIVKSPWFEGVTILVICVNAVWIGVALDYNNAATLRNAEWHFVVIEQAFCVFFAVELAIRFAAVTRKRDFLRDGWCVFDSFLVFFMVLENWVLFPIELFTGMSNNGLGGLTILRLLRLLRLTRVARLARALPELLTLVKALIASFRSVSLTMVMLIGGIYVFAVIFTQSLDGTELGKEYFDSVFGSMYTLLLEGILPDHKTHTNLLTDELWFYSLTFLFFVAIAAFMFINLLIGIICEVIGTAAQVYQTQSDFAYLEKMFGASWQKALETESPRSACGEICKEEFLEGLTEPLITQAFATVGLDAEAVLDHVEFLFLDPDLCERRLSLNALVNELLKLRTTNMATVRDIAELRKYCQERLSGMERQLRAGNLTATTESIAIASFAQDSPEIWTLELEPAQSASSAIRTDLVEEDTDCFTELHDLGQRMCRLECVMQRTAQTQSLILERLGLDLSSPEGEAKLEGVTDLDAFSPPRAGMNGANAFGDEGLVLDEHPS